jgi:hypothetical protein
MKSALVLAASFVLTTGASFAGDNCSKSSCETKKVSLISKLFHKKGESKKSSNDDVQVAGSNFIIN